MKDEIMSLVADFGEFTLDYFIEDNIIKDLPAFVKRKVYHPANLIVYH